MSELKDICVSYETAKALAEAGIVIDSVFAYFYYQNAKCPSEPYLKFTHDNLANWSYYPAPTFEEIDPKGLIFKNSVAYKLSIRKALNHWVVSYNNIRDQNDTLTDPEYNFTNEHSLCETMAEVMIQLKKEGTI